MDDFTEKIPDGPYQELKEPDLDGLSDLQAAVTVCQHSSNPTQKLFHVRHLAEYAQQGANHGDFLPEDFLEELSVDDDAEVREATSQQIGGLAALAVSLDPQQAGAMLDMLQRVALRLLEDDVDDVVVAAEKAITELAPHLSADNCDMLMIELLALSEEEEEEDVRLSVVRLLGSLCGSMGAARCQRSITPALIGLSKDTAFRVRKGVALAIPAVCAVAHWEIVSNILLPTFMRLSQDDVWSVRRGCAECLVELAQSLPLEIRVELVTELFEQLANDTSHLVKSGAYEALGPLLALLGPEAATDDLVSYYTSMTNMIAQGGEGSDDKLAYSCAFNFPAVAVTIGPHRWEELQEAFQTLMGLPQWKVRRTLACSLHHLAAALGPRARQADIQPAVEQLLGDSDEVKMGLVDNLAALLKCFPDPIAEKYLRQVAELQRVEGLRCGNWRIREALCRQLEGCAAIFPPAILQDVLIPAALHLCRDPAHCIRLQAANQVAALLCHLHHLHLSTPSDIFDSAKLFTSTAAHVRQLSTETAFTGRQLYVTIFAEMVGRLDDGLLIGEFLPMLLELAGDQVPNVRLELAAAVRKMTSVPTLSALPDVRAALTFLEADRDKDVCENTVIHRSGRGKPYLI